MEGEYRHLGGRKWVEGTTKRLVQAAGRVLFPHFCLSCGREGALLCPTCETNKYAPSRGILFSLDKSVRCFSAGRYADPVLRSLLHLYKYERVEEAGEILTRYFIQSAGRQVTTLLAGDNDPLVVPMPMHPVNRALRGFNQVEALAEVLAGDFELELAKNIVQRHFAWRAQARLSRIDRRSKNVAGVFYCQNRTINNRSVLLIDDVLTTGATALDCVRALQAAGAKSVIVVTVLKG